MIHNRILVFLTRSQSGSSITISVEIDKFVDPMACSGRHWLLACLTAISDRYDHLEKLSVRANYDDPLTHMCIPRPLDVSSS